MSADSIFFPPLRESRTGRLVPIVLGAAAASVVALATVFHGLLAVLGAAIVVWLAAIEYEPFLLLIIFLIPVQWRLASGIPIAAVARVLVVGGFFGGRLVQGRLSIRKMGTRLTWGSLLVLVAAACSVAFGAEGWTEYSSRALAALVSYVGFYFLLITWINSRQRLQKVAIMLLSSTVLVAAFGVFQEVVGGYTPLWLYLNPWINGHVITWDARVPSFLNYANSLAGYLNLILPFSLACWVLGRGRWRKLGGWAVILSSLALIFTQSRGGMVAFGCVLVFAVFHFIRSRRKRLFFFLGVLAVGIITYFIGALLSPGHLGEIEPNYAVGRLIVWNLAWQLFRGSLLFGVGVGNFPAAFQIHLGTSISQFVPWAVETHNLYLEFLAETGLVGTLAFFFLVAGACRESRRQLRVFSDDFSHALAFGVLGAMGATLVHGFVDVVILTSTEFGTLFWSMLALLTANAHIHGRFVSPRAH